MRRYVMLFSLALIWPATIQAQGVLLPADKSLASLSMVKHEVRVTIQDQVQGWRT